jgi:ribosomal protein S18 acetylase RimI-like enzyme
MPELTWVSLSDAPSEAAVELRKKLAADNREHSGIAQSLDLAVLVYGEPRELVGGVTGNLWGEVLEVDFLWVHPDLRGKGLGEQILTRLEEDARRRGARTAFLNTYSFQAPEFYRKQGYEVTELIEGYPEGIQKLFLKKRLG